MRNTKIHIQYNGKDVTTSLQGASERLTYVDNISGELDDFSLTVEDSAHKWLGAWSPTADDRIIAALEVEDRYATGSVNKFKLGEFYVDEVAISGPPSLAEIRATSNAISTDLKRTKRSRAWEKVNLKRIAEDIAAANKLKLSYQPASNPSYDRMDQSDEADAAFLVNLCASEGFGVKIANGKLVVFDETVYERQKPLRTISVLDTDEVIDYSFVWRSDGTRYVSCQVSYTKPKAKKPITVTYKPSAAPKTGPTLKLTASVESEAEALRHAKNELRNRNKQANIGEISMVGDPKLMAYTVIKVADAGRYSGDYLITRAEHDVSGSGYITRIAIRKVLTW